MDVYGAVKVKERYFTPDLREDRLSYGDFSLQLSIDKDSLILTEDVFDTEGKVACLIFNINSLELLTELDVNAVDEDIAHDFNPVDFYNEYEMNTPDETDFSTDSNLPLISSWCNSYYILVG
jgi:hypothetical protein